MSVKIITPSGIFPDNIAVQTYSKFKIMQRDFRSNGKKMQKSMGMTMSVASH